MTHLRYALRTLRKTPGFTLIAILAIAIGVGANSAIFSVVNAVLLRPLPYPEADRLVVASEISPHKERMSVAYPNLQDWRRMAHSYDALEAYRGAQLTITGLDRADRVRGRYVTAGFLKLLGVQPALGRDFAAEDDALNAKPVVILAHDFWKNRMGGGAGVIGRTITLSGTPTVIIGVLPASFDFGSWKPEYLLPMGPTGADRGVADRGNHQGIYAIGRLRAGTSLEQAAAEIKTIASQLEKQYPASNSGNSAVVVPVYDLMVSEARTPLLVLLGAVGMVLLIACSNVANLMLARSSARRKEMAIRAALGAGRWTIARQLLLEGAILSAAGGALGLLLSIWGVQGLVRMIPADAPRAGDAHMDLWVVAFTGAISVVTGLLFSLAPAIQASRTDLNDALKAAARGMGTSVQRHRLRKMLLATEIAMALTLSVGAALLIRSFGRLHAVDPGFRADHLLTFHVAASRPKYQKDPEYLALQDRVTERIRAIPGVTSASLISCLPIDGTCWGSIFVIEGKPVPRRADLPSSQWNIAGRGYFETMGIRLIRGRTFDASDRAESRPVVVVNESAARKFFPGEDAIGRRVKQGWPEWKGPFREIVGIVADVKQNGLDAEQFTEIYLPSSQSVDSAPFFVVRTATPPESIVATVRQEIAAIDRDLPVYAVRPMEDLLSTSVASRRFSMLLLTLFAGIAVFLAAIGVHGVVAYSVTQRTQEIGIRMALGARPGQVLSLVIAEGMLMAGGGIAAGICGALALTRLMRTLLFGIGASDPLSFASVAVALAAITLLASYLPARRAIKVDPVIALRVE